MKLESKFIESAWCKISFHARSTGSWGKVKIPKCGDFDGHFGKFKKNISIFTYILMIFRIFWYIFENPKILRMWNIMKFRKTIFWMFFYVPIDLYRLVSVSMSPSGHFGIFIVNITVLFALFGWIEVVLQISENLEIRMPILWFLVDFQKIRKAMEVSK